MFKSNYFLKQYQEYWSKNSNKDKFDSSAGNKLSLYSELKSEIRFETYLDKILKNFKTRTAVTKMWISCQLLPIESGCYKKIPIAERICPLCKRSAIGDEFHFWLKCNHSSLSHVSRPSDITRWCDFTQLTSNCIQSHNLTKIA